MQELYLDANAHVSLNQAALNKYIEFNKLGGAHGHPSSPSSIGREAARYIEESRYKIAQLIGAKSSSQIIFTNSCTQSCRWAFEILKRIQGLTYISQLEHPASSQACEAVLGLIYGKIPSKPEGIIDLSYKFKAGSIACIYVQNEIGTIQPIKELKQERILFSDMSQALGKIPLNVTDLDVDIAIFGSHKFGGPSGFGFMYLKDTGLWCNYESGSRYCLDIPGTPNVAGAVMTADALENALESLPERTNNMLEFRSLLEPGLEEMGLEIIGKDAPRCPNTTFAYIGSGRGIELLLALSKYNIHIGLGSACGALNPTNLLMKSLNKPSDGFDYIRISQFGNYGKKEAEYLLNCIKKEI